MDGHTDWQQHTYFRFISLEMPVALGFYYAHLWNDCTCRTKCLDGDKMNWWLGRCRVGRLDTQDECVYVCVSACTCVIKIPVLINMLGLTDYHPAVVHWKQLVELSLKDWRCMYTQWVGVGRRLLGFRVSSKATQRSQILMSNSSRLSKQKVSQTRRKTDVLRTTNWGRGK